MVHALKEIRRLLKPDGFLIDIHPIRKAPLIKVVQGADVLFVEADPGYDYDESLMHADDALGQVVHRGSYVIEGKDEFEVVTYSSSVSELRDYWTQYGAFEDELKDDASSARQSEMYSKADEVMQNAPGAEITYHERARIMRLSPNPSQ